MLSASDLASMQATQVETMTSTATVKRALAVPDGAGGANDLWSIVASVGCRFSPVRTTMQEHVVGERVAMLAPWTVTLPVETDVRSGDRLVIGARTFDVLVVQESNFSTALCVTCVEVV